MIDASEARGISNKYRFTYIEDQIKKVANKGLNSVSLKNNFSLKDEEKTQLKQLGYKIIMGHSGKSGSFDIISW